MKAIIDLANDEIEKLERMKKIIDDFMNDVPDGCLKWQNRNGKIYYYHQYMGKDKKERKKKSKRSYIRKEDKELAKTLARKHYYLQAKPIIEKNIKALTYFVSKYSKQQLDDIYDQLNVERKVLTMPLQISKGERIRQWKEEQTEEHEMYPENLRYETEQGDLVRSKSEVIIANMLYNHRADILYKYERPLNLEFEGKMKTVYPDFTILNIHSGKIVYLEHVGRLDDPNYASGFVKKMNLYTDNDLLMGRDVFLTFETQITPLDIGGAKRIIENILQCTS